MIQVALQMVFLTPFGEVLTPSWRHLDGVLGGLVTSWRRGREKERPDPDILKDVSNGMQGQHGRGYREWQLEGFTPPLREYLPGLRHRGVNPTRRHRYAILAPSWSSSFFHHFSHTFLYRFWLDFGPQLGAKIVPKSIPKLIF